MQYNGSFTKIKDQSLMLLDKKPLPNNNTINSNVLDSAITGNLHSLNYIVMDIPALTIGTDKTLDIKLQQSDDGENWKETCRVHLDAGSYAKERRAIGMADLKQFLRLQITTTEDQSAQKITAWMAPVV